MAASHNIITLTESLYMPTDNVLNSIMPSVNSVNGTFCEKGSLNKIDNSDLKQKQHLNYSQGYHLTLCMLSKK